MAVGLALVLGWAVTADLHRSGTHAVPTTTVQPQVNTTAAAPVSPPGTEPTPTTVAAPTTVPPTPVSAGGAGTTARATKTRVTETLVAQTRVMAGATTDRGRAPHGAAQSVVPVRSRDIQVRLECGQR